MMSRVRDLLNEEGIQPSAQRLAVGEVVLFTEQHPTADQVLSLARARFPWLSRATVYNTLKLFVQKGLLRTFNLGEGAVVYDPKTYAHHHFIEERTGRIHDVAFDALKMDAALEGLQVRDFHVVLRGDRPGDRATSDQPVKKSKSAKRKQPARSRKI